MVHDQRRPERGGHRPAGDCVSAFSGRSRAVVSQAVGDAPSGRWPGRFAGSPHQCGDRRRRRDGGKKSAGGDRARGELVAILDCDRTRAPLQSRAPDNQCRARELFHPARSGSRGHSHFVVRLHPGCKVQRVGSRQSCQRAVASRGRRHRHRYLRSRAAATAVPAGCDRRLQRTVHRGRAVRDRGGGRDRRSGRPVDGARRLPCRLAARRDGIPQGDRNDSRAVQGLIARHFLLYRGNECRLPRAVARAALAYWRRCQPDRRQIVAHDRSWPAVSSVVAGRDRDRSAARSGRGICLRRHRHGVGYGSDRSAARELYARCDLGHHGADAAAVIRRAVSHGAVHRGESRRSGSGRPACGRTAARNRGRLWPRRQGRVRAAAGAWGPVYRRRLRCRRP